MSDEKPRPHHVRCGRELSIVRGEWYCLKCWCTVELPMLSQAEAAKEASQGHSAAREVAPRPWTEEERHVWATWKEGDPVPGETKEMEDEPGLKTLNTAALGKQCIETLRYHQEQLALLDAKAARIREEAAKLVAIAKFAGVSVPAELEAMARGSKTPGKSHSRASVAGSVARDPNDSRNAWVCPDCGHRTVTRWVQRHKDECPQRNAA